MAAGVAHPKELVDRIGMLWREGRSSGYIAVELSMTRNAVVGMVVRMREKEGVELWPTHANKPPPPNRMKRRSPVKTASTATKAETRSLVVGGLKARPVRPPKPIKPLSDPIAWLSREQSQCAFIADDVGDVDSLQCCGALVIGESSYCSYHHDICTVPSDDRRYRRFRLPRIGVGA